MGYTKTPYGKPVFDDTYSFPQDSQAAVDYADEFANVRRGTALERQELTADKRREGLLWVESDTGLVYVYTGSGGWVLIAGRIRARRTKAANQSIANATWTTVTWPTESDPFAGLTYSSGMFTIPATGVYLVASQLAFATPNTTGQRVIRLRRNGDVIAQSTQVIPNATYPALPQFTIGVHCTAGDSLWVETYQSSGGAQNAGLSAESSFISIDRVS